MLLGFIKKEYFPKKLMPVWLLFPLSVYVMFTQTLLNGADYSELLPTLLKPIRIIITILGCYHFVLYIQHKIKLDVEQFMIKSMFWSIFIHACIMIMQLLNVEFKDWIYSYTTTGEFRGSYDYNFRMGGLSGGTGGAVLSGLQSVGILIAVYLWITTPMNRILILLASIVITASIIICGRTGLISLFIFTPMLGYLLTKNKRKYLISMGGIMLTVIVVFMGIINWILNYDIDSRGAEGNEVYYAVRRSLDTAIESVDQGEVVSDPTVLFLKKMILFPSDPAVLILGNPLTFISNSRANKNFSERYVESDIGYINNIWGYGLIGTFIFLFPSLYITYTAFKKMRDNKVAALLFIISIEVFFLHTKEQFIMVRMYFSVICLLFFLIEYHKDYSIKV